MATSLAPGRSAELYQLDASATHFSKTTDGSAYDVSRGLDLLGSPMTLMALTRFS